MTIFDSIRYPISCPPTAEQLEAVPDEIFDEWRDKTHFTVGKGDCNIISDWISRFWTSVNVTGGSDGKSDTELLIKMISEYEG